MGLIEVGGLYGASMIDRVVVVGIVRTGRRGLTTTPGCGGVPARIEDGGVAVAHACEGGEFLMERQG